MDVKGRVVALVGEERRHTGRSIGCVVVGEFGEGKKVGPFVLLIQTVVLEVLF